MDQAFISPASSTSNGQESQATHDNDFVTFPCLPAGQSLNRWSSYLTSGHEFPAAQAMLYAAGVTDTETLKTAPHVGIASVWWEGNPCNSHLLGLSKIVKKAVEENGMLGWQYNTIGVSDGITMGGQGMRFSLQSREIIADSIETVTCAQHHDANISIPGCDKNMPGVVMAAARHNRPFLMIYGGSIRTGHSKLLGRNITVSDCFETSGAVSYEQLQSKTLGATPSDILDDVIRNACPGAGACGGMYTANTMACAIESMGMTLPGSSSFPAASPEKARECQRAAETIKGLMQKDIRPRSLLTRAAFENALVITTILGGSTNAVLHLLAMAHTADIELSLDDFARTASRTPLLAELAPSGPYHMEDLYRIGGTPSVLKMLIAADLVDGTILTVTGHTLAENVQKWPSLPVDQKIIRPLSDPIKMTGHLRILKGNLAPGGAVAKITGKEGLSFSGRARVFNKEQELNDALSRGLIPRGQNLVLVVRYEGPCGGPGMPEQLKASGAIKGARLRNIALITDGRYSGASDGFIVGHIVPEAAKGGPIALVKDDDVITIDAVVNSITVDVDATEMKQRKEAWQRPPDPVRRGVLAKYARLVGDASHGAVTDE